MKQLIAGMMLLLGHDCAAQQSLQVHTANEEGRPLSGTTIELLRAKDSGLLKLQVADTAGNAQFHSLPEGAYLLKVSHAGYALQYRALALPAEPKLHIVLYTAAQSLGAVTVRSRRPLVELQPGKTVVHVENSITAAGTTVLEALEKMPGVTVDKDGVIALKGKTGITVMLDGRPTYLNGSELATLLGGMSAATISQVELMEQPPARYDAAGNAGIINIKTKKTQQKGFYGSAGAAYSQGVYPKTNNSVQLNYRSGKWNLFANYGFNYNRNFTRIDALRTYLQPDEKTVISLLNQPSYLTSEGRFHNLRSGADYTLNNKTSIGFSVNTALARRNGLNTSNASWLNAQNIQDSLVATTSRNGSDWKSGGANLNLRHTINKGSEFSADLDWLGYGIRTTQQFDNKGISPIAYTESSRGQIPININIYSAKADYQTTVAGWKLETGWKSVRTKTDNAANFEWNSGSGWQTDFGRTNRFLYNENIHAVYTSAQRSAGKWTWQGGLRFEHTALAAHQLGNALVKDSAFSRSYGNLFPTTSISLAADSNHSFSITAGRRIDRPPFQKLNPFQFIINKYTYQQGNALYRPQFTWNIELAHSYKGHLLTSIGYSVTKDFFSQVFPIDNNGIVIYTEGNLGKLQVWTASVGTQMQPVKWWNLSGQFVLNHRIMQGVIGRLYNVSFTQFNLNLNNQFRFGKGWNAELTGFFSSKGRNDIQEIVDPAGQLSAGIAKTVLQQKGTVRLAVRDILYTQWMKGFTYFQQATEWFKLTRDTRVVTLSFNYRFGKTFKQNKRSAGGAREEAERVGNG